ncbi:30S ribosomal protein S20 [Spiroplasma platyhelix]|uniref:Small ribosomal subunit protein bS20 n=1 Tax=Spiroplasma platyhelix PALS-1 TaxID=1276218 RepID=A0A846UA50_9MOLU|nr:30S ribosomal protein S20 [Spiroplasma platyhelix]MBE4704371.1 30S ribosomal protein S20 [Spiroplasma platyhelix PALS-1]NKE38743.1 30S ribosomal protein S20 [Spiroplasma platyhelix PALS-1]UJB28954.1 30S ribosomal protein S20 [Spiroplasma platyhelix PALS-1]
MANIKSQIKRIKTNEKDHQINKSYKSKVKTAYNKAIAAINAHSESAGSLVNEFCSLMDKGVSKGVFHANKAANKKARMMTKYNKSLEAKK